MLFNWIKVGDRLPEDDDTVLAAFIGWDDMVFIRALDYDPKYKEWSDHEGEVYETVTHWVAIEPPKK